MKGRPLCTLACILAALLAVLHTLGVTDRTQRVRSSVQEAEIFAQGTLSDWDTVAAAGRITRITHKDDGEGMAVRLQDVVLAATADDAAAVLSGTLPEGSAVCRIPSGCHIQVSLKSADTRIHSGDRVVMTGKALYPAAATCPGQFDMLFYANTNGRILSLVSASVSDYAPDVTQGTWLEKVREWVSASYERVLGTEDAGAMSAITLGEKSAIPEEVRGLFQDGGISHVLAISGLHINMLGMSLYRLLRRRRCSFVFSAAVSGSLLSLYCLMTGMSSSALRATIMFVVWTGSQVAGRSPDTLSALALAACLLLSRSPLAIFDGGFQLSFGCILSLQCLGPLLSQLLGVKSSRTLLDKIRSSLASSLAITIGTLPILALHYYQFNPYSPLLNLIVLPAMSVLVLSGFGGALIGNLLPAAGVMAAAPCHYLLRLFCLLCRLTQKLPYAMIVTGKPSAAQIIIYYAVLLLLLRLSRLPGKTKPVILAGNIALLCLTQVPCGDLRMIFLDVGQGLCVIAQSGTSAVMLDAGSSSMDEVWTYRVEPCLKSCGIRHVTALVTHGDLDHVNGLQQWEEAYETNLIGMGCDGITLEHFCTSIVGDKDETLQELSEAWAEAGVMVSALDVGTVLTLGKTSFTVLYPGKGDLSDNSNENSLTILAECEDNFKVLLTGDLEKDAEDRFLGRYRQLGQIDILSLGHHGSKYATSEDFLAAFSPTLAVASAGQNNRYGHPSSEVIERLEKAGTGLLRTDTMGSVIVEESGSKRCVQVMKTENN